VHQVTFKGSERVGMGRFLGRHSLDTQLREPVMSVDVLQFTYPQAF
jgi:hypothetical protein